MLADQIHLNIYRHPAIPIPRGRETFDQANDPAFRAFNDDIDEQAALPQIRRATQALDLDPALPLFIWHSHTRRARRAAVLFAVALAPIWTPPLSEVPALGEPAFELGRLVSREQFDDRNRPPGLVREAFFRAVLADDRVAVSRGRADIAGRVLALRERLAGLPPSNLLCVSHGLLMPFLYLTLVSGIEPDDWTFADLLALGPRGAFGYAEGFAHRLPAGATAVAVG